MKLLSFAANEYIMYGSKHISICLIVWGACSFLISVFLLLKHKPLPNYRMIVFMSFFLAPGTIAGFYYALSVYGQGYFISLVSARVPKTDVFWYILSIICLVPYFWWLFVFRGDYFLLYPYFRLVDILRRDPQRKGENLLADLTSPNAPPITKLLFALYLTGLISIFVGEIFFK